MTEAYNIDCMEYMKTLPDKAFDLAIVDPPYGDGTSGGAIQSDLGRDSRSTKCHQLNNFPTKTRTKNRNTGEMLPGFLDMPSVEDKAEGKVERRGGTWASKYDKKIISWDIAPPKEYFDELFRVSKNQVIWGGNYFYLPPTRCFLIWRKLKISDAFSMAMAEYAWTSFNSNAKVFEAAPQGTKQDERFHPTQKPVKLYKWILSHYAKPGDKILDTHLGSGSSRIAADELGFDFVGCELDPYYFQKQEERFKDYSSQMKLF